jgi:carbonic anhydrase/acetyltransferase-like protein (isoleucine patch superfamily)
MPLLKRGVPKLSPDIAYLAPCASLIGTVHIGAKSSVFYGAILRADACNMGCGRSEEELERWKSLSREDRLIQDLKESDLAGDKSTGAVAGGIFIGENTNIQDGCIITSKADHTMIGNGVTVGHCAQIHSATVGDHSLIGMGAILNPGSKVESLSFVAAGAVVGKHQVVKSGELWVGNPARKLRDLTKDEKQQLFYQAEEYVKVATTQSNVMQLGGGTLDLSSRSDCKNNDGGHGLKKRSDGSKEEQDIVASATVAHKTQ